MKSFKESALRIRQQDIKPMTKIMATQYVEKGNVKKVIDLLKHMGKKVKLDVPKGKDKSATVVWTVEGSMHIKADTKKRLEAYKKINEAINYMKVSKELDDYAKKHGGIDKREFEKAAAYVREIGRNSSLSVQDKAGKGLNMLFKNADTDVRDRLQMILTKGGFKVKGGYVMRESVDLSESPKVGDKTKYQGSPAVITRVDKKRQAVLAKVLSGKHKGQIVSFDFDELGESVEINEANFHDFKYDLDIEYRGSPLGDRMSIKKGKGKQVIVTAKGRDLDFTFRKAIPDLTGARLVDLKVKGMDHVGIYEAALKTSDYPKGTSMSAQKFKDSKKKMSKQRALSTKDYPKGTSMSATAWKNKQEEVDLEEKAVSKAQQKFMGMVRAKQKGEMDDASPEVEKAAKSMSKKDVKDFAKTKHKGLPDKKESSDLEEKGKGLWYNIRKKRARGERPAKPGEKGYPKTLDIESTNEAKAHQYSSHADKSMRGGYRAKLVGPKGVVYLGSKAYKTPKAAKGEADAYHDGYFNTPSKKNNDKAAMNRVHDYRTKHANKMQESSWRSKR